MNNNKQRSEERLFLGMSSAIFLAFSFCYLFYYQSGLMEVTQRMVSHGQTQYNDFVGALIITIVLFLLQMVTLRSCKVLQVLPSLSFFPSALTLGLLTSLQIQGNTYSFPMIGTFIALMVLFIVLMFLLNYYKHALVEYCYTFSLVRRILIELTIILFTLFAVLLLGNNDKVLHIRLKAEQCLRHDDPRAALDVLNNREKPDSTLTMLRAYALSVQGNMAEELFKHQLIGGSSALMPSRNAQPQFTLYSEKDFYRHLGSIRRKEENCITYLERINRKNNGNKNAQQYLLCAYLMDKKLDDFVDLIHQNFAINDSLSKHFREALCLYTHQHSAPKVVYKNDVMEADYQDYQRMQASYPNKAERQTKLHETFGNTYWYYFDYE